LGGFTDRGTSAKEYGLGLIGVKPDAKQKPGRFEKQDTKNTKVGTKDTKNGEEGMR